MTHGLPYSALRCVYQSTDGYLWISSRAGVSRFDGITFTNFFKPADGISLDEATYFAQDNDGRLWIGTRSGIIWLKNGRWTKPVLHPEIDTGQITGLLSDGDGVLITTINKVFRWERDSVSTVETGTKQIFNYTFKSLYRLSNGDVLVLGDSLVRLREKGLPENISEIAQIPGNSKLRAVTQTADGKIWIGTSGGLYRWDGNSLTHLPKIGDTTIAAVRSLYTDRDNNLWIGTPNGLSRYRGNHIEHVLLQGDDPLGQILAISEDREGNLWCGTDSGLLRLRDVKVTNLTIRNKLPVNSIQTIHREDDGVTWICTRGGGLLRLEGEHMEVLDTKTGLSSDSPLVVHRDSAKNLWVGYYSNGVDCITADGQIIKYSGLKEIVNGIAESGPDTLLVSSNQSLFQARGGHLEPDSSFGSLLIRALFRDSKGRAWASWDGGVAIFENGRWEKHPTPGDGGNKTPAAFRETSDGAVWLLRDKQTLERFKDESYARLTLPEIGGRLSFGFIFKDSDAWFQLRNGILRISREALETALANPNATLPFEFFDESDGMRSPAPNSYSFSSIADMGDKGLWFASTRGIAIIHPDRIRTNKIPPNVAIESIVANRKSLDLQSTLRVPPGRGELLFVYTALSLTDANANRFKYKLEGFDSDWVDAGTKREAYYGGLPPGLYKFRVIASNNDDIWNNEGASVSIFIAPHYYQTWWFWPLTVGTIVALFSFLYRRRTHQLEKQKSLLQAEVDLRTKDLKAAHDDALAASKAKSDFVANMSHEIRTPMNGVIGMTELALGLAKDKELRSYLKVALTSGDALMSVINDILDFSKIESGKLTIDRAEFSLSECVKSVIDPLSLRAAQKKIELICEIAPCIPNVLIGDEHRLRQILFNLLGNALKFTSQGQISLSITADGEIDERCPLHLCIADSGPGIATDRVGLIFQPFVQADNSTTRRYGGTGLGLTICKQLVELMGGKIWVDSELGKGSHFHVLVNLPVGKNEPSNIANSSLFSGPVLIVDDHPQSLEAHRKLVEEVKLTPLVASNSKEALAYVQEANAKPSLLIIDEQLGETSGYDLIQRLRSISAFAETPVILLIAADQTGDQMRCSELGIDHKLRKPVFRNQLIESLNSASHKTKKVSSAPLPEISRLRPLKVLVAEDNAVNQLVVRKMLEIGGHQVVIVGDGQAAVERYLRENFDLILMDLQMPVLDGREATTAIRNHESGTKRRIPIVALTAHAMSGDVELCLSSGMDAYLTKPLKRTALNNILERFFYKPSEEAGPPDIEVKNP